MVKYIIIKNEKCSIVHEIIRLGRYNNKEVGGFIQELQYYGRNDERQHTIQLTHEEIRALKEGLLEEDK